MLEVNKIQLLYIARKHRRSNWCLLCVWSSLAGHYSRRFSSSLVFFQYTTGAVLSCAPIVRKNKDMKEWRKRERGEKELRLLLYLYVKQIWDRNTGAWLRSFDEVYDTQTLGLWNGCVIVIRQGQGYLLIFFLAGAFLSARDVCHPLVNVNFYFSLYTVQVLEVATSV